MRREPVCQVHLPRILLVQLKGRGLEGRGALMKRKEAAAESTQVDQVHGCPEAQEVPGESTARLWSPAVPAPTLDVGCRLDPLGRCVDGVAPITDAGCIIDPLGRCL